MPIFSINHQTTDQTSNERFNNIKTHKMASESNQEYSVNWKNHMSHVRKAFDKLLTSNELTDVTLHCEGKKIGAHKVLLSACSDYFRDAFKDVPCKHPVIFMYGVEFGVLSDILRFIYNGEVSVDTSKLDMFLKTAQVLRISGLSDCATEKIAGLNESVTQQPPAVEENVEEAFEESPTPASSGSDEARKGIKRPKTKETETSSKVMRQENDQVFLSEVKSEPSDSVNFEDLLEDPLLQTDQSDDSKDFFGAPGQSLEDEEFKYCSVSSDYEDFATKVTSSSVSSDTEEHSTKVTTSVIPERSRSIYELAYERFEKWCEEQNLKNAMSEEVLLAYFEYKSKVQKPSSLWANYSMLRTVISTKQNVDISKYKDLNAFLKKKAAGYQSKKSKILTRQDVARFLTEADDNRFLLMKVALIIGLGGACRSAELTNLVTDNVQDEGQFFRIVIPNARTKAPQEFFITSGVIEGLNMVQIIRKYVALRPAHAEHRRFFVGFRHAKCTIQPVGKHTFSAMPKVIASFLKLPNPEEYTGHCFRMSSSSFKR